MSSAVHRRRGLRIGLVAICLFAASVVPADRLAAQTAPPAQVHTVELSGISFKDAKSGSTSQMAIRHGDSVRFKNIDTNCHTVTRGKIPASGYSDCSAAKGTKNETDFDVNLKSGQSVTILFNSTETVDLYCRPHASSGMAFRILVKEELGETDGPTPSGATPLLLGALLGVAVLAGVMVGLMVAVRRRHRTK